MYLWWFDDTPKKPIERKVEEAAAAYRERTGHGGNIALVNPDEGASLPATFAGLAVQRESYIRVNNVWIGYNGGS